MTEEKLLLQTHTGKLRAGAQTRQSGARDSSEVIRSHWVDPLGREKKETYEKKAQD